MPVNRVPTTEEIDAIRQEIDALHAACPPGYRFLFAMSEICERGQVIRTRHPGTGAPVTYLHPLDFAKIIGIDDWRRAIDLRAAYHLKQLRKAHKAAHRIVFLRWKWARLRVTELRDLPSAYHEALYESPETWCEGIGIDD